MLGNQSVLKGNYILAPVAVNKDNDVGILMNKISCLS